MDMDTQGPPLESSALDLTEEEISYLKVPREGPCSRAESHGVARPQCG